MHASLLGISLEALVRDNDMLGNILRSVRGVEATTENIAADVIAGVCRGAGHYLGEIHTFDRMKCDYFYPHIGDRRAPAEWQEDGSKSVGDVARTKTKEILANYHSDHVDDAIDIQL